MEILVKGFSNNAGTYGNMCSCDCNCNCNCASDSIPQFPRPIECARKYGYVWTGCNRYTPSA